MELAATVGECLALAGRSLACLRSTLAVDPGAMSWLLEGHRDRRLAPARHIYSQVFEGFAESARGDAVDPPNALLVVDNGMTIKSCEGAKLGLRHAGQLSKVAQIGGAIEATPPRRGTFDAAQLLVTLRLCRGLRPLLRVAAESDARNAGGGSMVYSETSDGGWKSSPVPNFAFRLWIGSTLGRGEEL